MIRFLNGNPSAIWGLAVTIVCTVYVVWDNLDSGLKQWIVMGVSMALSFTPLVGPLISCIVDGTFVDMINALRTGDWAMLGMCCLNFVPGGKGAGGGLKALFAIGGAGGVAGILGVKAAKSFGRSAEKKALKELVLEKGGKAFRFSDDTAGHASHHVGDIAGKYGLKNIDETKSFIKNEWKTVGGKLKATNPDYVRYDSPRGLTFILDERYDTIVTIYPPH